MPATPSPADFNTLGRQLEAAGKPDSAVEAFRGALALDPLYRPAVANLVRMLVALGRPREAVALAEPVAAAAPFDLALSVNYANALMGIGRVVEAEQRLRAILQNGSVPPQVHNSLGVARYIQRDFAAARDAFGAAITADSAFAEAHENLAQALLHLGDYEQAWVENDWRWRNPSNALTKRIFTAPEWDGKPLSGCTLLLHGEQGHGDTIQFARFARFIDKGNGGRIALACQEALAPLLSTVPGIDAVHVLGGDLPPHDCQAPIVTLPRLLGGRFATETCFTGAYIAAEPDPEIAARPGPKIGINWTGKALHPHDPYRNRSCPPEYFAVLAEKLGASLFSLQYGMPADQAARAGAIDLAPRIADFSDTACFVMAMDAVVTIDTALAHIAGALAKPCWVLPPFTADWRWSRPLGDGTQAWYPSVRAIRQAAPGDWAGSFARLVPQLSQHMVDGVIRA